MSKTNENFKLINKKIPSLYRDGIVKVENLFDQSLLDEIVLAKNKIFFKTKKSN